jgi:hypothetical protein
LDGKPPFHDLGRKAFKGEVLSPFEYFWEKLAREGKWRDVLLRTLQIMAIS